MPLSALLPHAEFCRKKQQQRRACTLDRPSATDYQVTVENPGEFAVPERKEIAAALLRFAAERADLTFCPSEVARFLAPEDWRPLMPAIREEAERLVARGDLRCWQRGRPASPTKAKGPIRLSA